MRHKETVVRRIGKNGMKMCDELIKVSEEWQKRLYNYINMI